MNPFMGGSGGPGNPNDPQNQMMIMSLREVTPVNILPFLMQNGDLVEADDNVKFNKASKSFMKNFTFVVIGGVFLNIQIKKVPKINFLAWHFLIRNTFRIPIFFSPGLLLYKQFDACTQEIFNLHYKYFSRIQITRRTGDLRYLDPQGILAKQFDKKMKDGN